MPFSFPASPTVGQQSTQNGRVYQWTAGGAWELVATPGSIDGAAITTGTVDVARLPVGQTSTTVAAGNDARFTDARTPTSHASSHQIGGSDALSNVVNSPSQITANQNDYSLPSADVVRLDSNAARDITGFSGGMGGRVVVLINVGSFAITLKHQSTSSTASNRVIVPWSADYILDPSYAAVLLYDATASQWRVV